MGRCGHLGPVGLLNWGFTWHRVSSPSVAFTVVPRCSPLDLVRLWCTPLSSIPAATLPTSAYARLAAYPCGSCDERGLSGPVQPLARASAPIPQITTAHHVNACVNMTAVAQWEVVLVGEVAAWFEALAEEDWNSAEQVEDAIDMLAATGPTSAVHWSIESRVLRIIT
ncbi:hypothetical protein RKD18_004509 [Streptomyces phaeoluteigriseus]